MDPIEDLRDPAQPKPGEDGGDLIDPPEEQGADLPEDVETLKTRLNNAERTIVGLKKTAGVNTVKELKGKLAPPKPAEEPQKPRASEGVTREEIALLQKGYSPEEIDVAMRLAPGKSMTDAINDPTAAAAIDGIRRKNKMSSSTPEPSDRVPVHQGKSFGELTPQEKSKNYAGTLDTLVKQGRQKDRSPGR